MDGIPVKISMLLLSGQNENVDFLREVMRQKGLDVEHYVSVKKVSVKGITYHVTALDSRE